MHPMINPKVPLLNQSLVVVGQGYVGLPLAIRAAEIGFIVTGLDSDVDRVGRLSAGDSYVEDISNERLSRVMRLKKYRATAGTSALDGFDIAVITVPTPLVEGEPDLKYVRQAAASVAPFVRPGALVVLESTTYPGTTRNLLVPELEKGSKLRAGTDFFVAYSPERIDPGNSRWKFENTPKVLAGLTSKCTERAVAFYELLVEETVEVSSLEVAELVKLIENTFRHVNIAMINELSIFARQLGINIWDSINAAKTKPFGYMPFYPGPGVGGHCLPIDPIYLSWAISDQLGEDFRFVSLANDVNDSMPHYVLRRIEEVLGKEGHELAESSIALVGLGYKKNSSDYRESACLKIYELLRNRDVNVEVFDPLVSPEIWPTQIPRIESYEQIAAHGLVVLVTDHDAVDYHSLVDNARQILDCTNRLPGIAEGL